MSQVRHWALSNQGQGHGTTLKMFSIYYSTNCQFLYVSFGTIQEVVIKYHTWVNHIIGLRYKIYEYRHA